MESLTQRGAGFTSGGSRRRGYLKLLGCDRAPKRRRSDIVDVIEDRGGGVVGFGVRAALCLCAEVVDMQVKPCTREGRL